VGLSSGKQIVTSSSLLGSLHWGESLKMGHGVGHGVYGEGSNSTQECLNTTICGIWHQKSGLCFKNGGRIERSQFCHSFEHTMNFGCQMGSKKLDCSLHYLINIYNTLDFESSHQSESVSRHRFKASFPKILAIFLAPLSCIHHTVTLAGTLTGTHHQSCNLLTTC